MTIRRLLPLLLALLLLLPAGDGRARADGDVPGDLEEEAAGFMAGTMIFIFLHELGHGLVDLLDLPVVGPEEDVVDEFATMLLLEAVREADTPAEAEQTLTMLLNAAQSWQLMWKGMKSRLAKDPDAFPWWGEHSADIKRYYNILCLLYGSDPGTFWPIVVESGIPIERARKCEREYGGKKRNWERLLERHFAGEAGGAAPAAGQRGRFVVVYGDTGSEFGRELERSFRSEGAWEELARLLTEEVILPPGEVVIRFADCGVENAFWNPGDRSITMCYEMFAFVLKLYANEVRTQLAVEREDRRAPPGVPPGTASAGERFGILAPALDAGEDPPWSRAFEGDAYVLRNRADDSSIYRITVSTPEIEGRRVVTADLTIEPGVDGAAGGLQFGADEGGQFLLLLVPGRGVGAFRFAGGRMERLETWTAEVTAGTPHRLTVVEQGREIAVALDRRQLGNLRDPAFGRGPVGIVAFGTGTFRFLAFSATELGAPTPTPTPGPAAPTPPVAAPSERPGQPGPVTRPAPPQPPPPSRDPRFAGVWTAYLQDARGGRTVIQLQLYADGRYLETRWLPDRTVARVWGGWTTVGGMLDFVPQGWDPWQRCDARGCVPLQPPPRNRLSFLWLGDDSLQLGELLYYRTR